jgi:polyhydroxyalkanoate synthesis regulator phasin
MTGKAYRNKEDEMADFKFGDGIKTIILAGVGAVAYSAEKGQEIIGELVKKGEITVEQGKDLSGDLQRSFKESMGKRGIDIDEISEKVSKMSSEELAKIKEQLANAEKLVSERLKKVEEDGEEAVAVAEEVVEEVVETAGAAEEAAEEPAEEAPVEEPAEEEKEETAE